MAKIPIIQSLVAKDAKYIVMPPHCEGETGWGDLAHPDVYVLDTYQKYPIGAKFVDGDRVFHYGYCSAVNFSGSRGMGGMQNVARQIAIAADAVIHAVGETEIVLEDTESTVNQHAGGYFMPRVNPYSYYRVLSNTATDDTHVTLTLERGLITAMAASEDGFLNENPYGNLESNLPNSGNEAVSTMGVCLVQAVASRYMWIQTWGPCYVTGGDERLGAADYRRNAVFHIDGTLYCPATVGQEQYAGYALPQTQSAAGTHVSTWFIFLMLAC